MNPLLSWLEGDWRAWLATLVVLVGALLVRALTVQALQRSRLPLEVRRQWLARVRGAMVALVLLCLVVIWAEELRGLALSIAAVAVAFVISTKEVILCLLGSSVRTLSRSFGIGDRIEINGMRGDVVELGALTTTLLEVGPGARQTGRAVVLPNSLLLGAPVVNETFAGEYGLHQLKLAVPSGDDWREAERRLLDAARAECGAFVEPARRYTADEAWKRGLGPDSVDPTVTLALTDPGRVDLLLRFPSPSRSRAAVEQAILRRFLEATAARVADGPAADDKMSADPAS